MRYFLLAACFLILSACSTTKTLTHIPEVNLRIVDEQSKPLFGIDVLSNSKGLKFMSGKDGFVMLPADAEKVSMPNYMPGGYYPVYNNFLIIEKGFKPKYCRCRSMSTIESNCPYYTVKLSPDNNAEKDDTKEKLTRMFKMVKRVDVNYLPYTNKETPDRQLECYEY